MTATSREPKAIIFAFENENEKAMKVKLTKEQIQKVVDDPKAAEEAGIKVSDPWWVIALKVLAYLIGLLLAGSCTTLVAQQIIQ